MSGMRNIILLMPLTSSLASAQQVLDCGPGCVCATLPKIDETNPQRLREMVDRVADTYHQAHPELPKELALRLLLEAVDELDSEFQDTIQDEVISPRWDDDQIVLFSSAELKSMINSTLQEYDGRTVHSFLKSVELLDDDAMFDLNPDNYHELIDEVKGAMTVLERTYNSILGGGGDETETETETEAQRAVHLGSLALVSVYGYASYVIFTAMVNFFAKVEMNNHG